MGSGPVFSNAALDEEFQLRGYVVTPFLESTEIAQLRELYFETVPGSIPAFYSTIFDSDLDRQKYVSSQIEAILAPKVSALLPGHEKFLNNFISKPGNTPAGRLGLHQDYTLVDQDRHTAVHLWCPLQDVGVSNGCLWVLAGSHSLVNHISAMPAPFDAAKGHAPDRVRLGTNPSPYDLLRDEIEAEFTTPVPMTAGHAFFFNERLLHSSEGNASPDPRIAVAGAYLPRGVKPRLHLWDHTQPEKLDIIELRDAFVVRFGFDLPVSFPYPDGVTYAGSRPFHPVPLRREQLESLRRLANPHRSTNSADPMPSSPSPEANRVLDPVGTVGRGRSRSWFARLTGL